jgi:hypothetical protein
MRLNEIRGKSSSSKWFVYDKENLTGTCGRTKCPLREKLSKGMGVYKGLISAADTLVLRVCFSTKETLANSLPASANNGHGDKRLGILSE